MNLRTLRKWFLTTFFLAAGVLLNFAASTTEVATYQSCLDNLFIDKACTELKSGITAENLDQNESYMALPETLKRMAMKIAQNDWSESYDYSVPPFTGQTGNGNNIDWANISGDWDDLHARKYRVQLYEPYSKGDAAASMAGITQYTNMNNPTGILGDAGSTIYVMVDNDIPAGTSLYIDEVADYDLNDRLTSGTKLNKGLNVITCAKNNAHYFIYYSAPTVIQSSGSSRYQPDAKYRLSGIPPVKIHIEGGRLNGFFNYVGDTRSDSKGKTLYTPDTEEDFIYTVQRATNPMYDLIGRYVILHFHLFDTDKGGETPIKGVKSALFANKTEGEGREYNPVSIMSSWDEMCLNERILMGLQNDEELAEYNASHAEKIFKDRSKIFYSSIVNTHDQATDGKNIYRLDPGYFYSDYFNNRLMGLSQDRDGLFMSATSWRMNFHINTVEAILTLFNHGDIWGPAHEYGHINQGPMNMAGTTEESNNIFSNVAVYFVGNETSRSDFISSQFKIFQENKNFLENGTWGTTRMFWQLWCYYHATGHNTKFYPRLYELLRNYPLKKVTRPGKHNLRYDQLHFAKMCCIAAEEDLTDFFTAWGFFLPFDYMFIGDYSTYDAYLTQEDIDAVKAEIAAFKFPKNESIILIDDRPGVTDRKSYNGFPIEKAGEYGGLEAFRNEIKPEGNFSFALTLNQVKIETDGTPGAGYIIRDKSGNLLGFSNSGNFEVSDELAEKLRNGEALITAIGADKNHTKAQVTNTVIDGSDEQKKAILKDIISEAAEVLKYVDKTETRVGYIKEEAAASLQTCYDKSEAQIKLENPDMSLTELIDNLSAAYNDLLDNENSFIGIALGNTYALYNNGRGEQYSLTTDGKTCTATKTGNQSSVPENQQWFIQPLTDGTYYLKNFSSNVYVSSGGVQSASFNVSATDRIALAVNPVRVKGKNIGLFSIAPPDNSFGMHLTNDRAIIGWTTSAGASQWTIVKVHDSTDDALSGKLIGEYRSLLEGLIQKYVDLEKIIDPHGVRVGYLKPESPKMIEDICSNIRTLVDDNNLTIADYERIYQEEQAQYDYYSTFGSELYIDIEPGAAYLIVSVNNASRALSATGSNLGASNVSDNSFDKEWIFEKSDVEGMHLLRNFGVAYSEKNAFIPSRGISYDMGISLNEHGDPYELIPTNGNPGCFGISADGQNMNSLVINSDGTAVSLSMIYDTAGQWTIRKIRDKEYVNLRDKLRETMQKSSDLLLNHWSEFPDIETYMKLWNTLEDASDLFNNVYSSSEQFNEILDNLSNLYAQCDVAVNKSEIVTVSLIQGFNDSIDDSTSNTNRCAYCPSGIYTFPGFLKLSKYVEPSSISVSVYPTDDWISVMSGSDISKAYRDAFASLGVEPKVSEQFDKIGNTAVDGFWIDGGACAEIDISGKEGDYYVYDLILKVPCSGSYEISIAPADKSVAFFDKDGKVLNPSSIEIYPNITALFNSSKGFNIEGFEINDEANKTIVIPLEYIHDNSQRLRNFKAYLPGIYFVDTFSISTGDLPSELFIGDEVNRYSLMKLSKAKAKGFNAIIDLSELNIKGDTEVPIIPITVTVEKNGAKSVYNVNVTTLKDISTGMLPVSVEFSADEAYYDLNGNRVHNPDHGIYVIIRNGRAYKIIR